MGDQLFRNTSVFSCHSAVKYSILYRSWVLSLHWVIVGGCGFRQEAVITLFAIRRKALRNVVWLFSFRQLSGNIPKISIDKHVFISLCMFCQYSDNFGQSQNICGSDVLQSFLQSHRVELYCTAKHWGEFYHSAHVRQALFHVHAHVNILKQSVQYATKGSR